MKWGCGSCSEIYLEKAFSKIKFKPQKLLPNAKNTCRNCLNVFSWSEYKWSKYWENDTYRNLLMSCRVLGRRMVKYTMTELIKSAKSENVELVMGEFIPTPKSTLVKNLYIELGLTILPIRKIFFLFLWSGVISKLVNLLSLILSNGANWWIIISMLVLIVKI